MVDPIDVTTDGLGTQAYHAESITLDARTEGFSGVYHDGTDKVYYADAVGASDHDGSPTEPTAAGQTIAGISNI